MRYESWRSLCPNVYMWFLTKAFRADAAYICPRHLSKQCSSPYSLVNLSNKKRGTICCFFGLLDGWGMLSSRVD